MFNGNLLEGKMCDAGAESGSKFCLKIDEDRYEQMRKKATGSP